MLHSRFQPLSHILSYDIFDKGFNGWMILMPNFTEHPDFDTEHRKQRPMATRNVEFGHLPFSRHTRLDERYVQPQNLYAPDCQSLFDAARTGFDGARHQAHVVL